MKKASTDKKPTSFTTTSWEKSYKIQFIDKKQGTIFQIVGKIENFDLCNDIVQKTEKKRRKQEKKPVKKQSESIKEWISHFESEVPFSKEEAALFLKTKKTKKISKYSRQMKQITLFDLLQKTKQALPL